MKDIYKQTKRLIDAELNFEYIARYLNIKLETVKMVDRLTGRLDGFTRLGTMKKLAHQAMKPEPPPLKPRFVPATRPFPVLTPDMTDGDRIIILTNHGLSARKIRKYLHNPLLSAKAINKYVLKKLGPAPKGNASLEKHNQISVTFMPYVIEALTRLGKDRYTCEICLEPVPKGCIVHHTKYEGATVYDLMYVCGSCNLSRANKGLA